MTDTAFWTAQAERLATAYLPTPGGLVVWDAAQKAHGGLGPGFFLGRSWSYCQAVLAGGAFGWDGGFGSSWLVDPVRDLVVIVLTQRMFETSDLPRVHRDIQAAAYAAIS